VRPIERQRATEAGQGFDFGCAPAARGGAAERPYWRVFILPTSGGRRFPSR